MFTKKYSSAIALLQLLSSISGALTHPSGMPRLMGRNGFVNLERLENFPGNSLVKRAVSPDGSCGGTNKYTCPTTATKCCSQYGWCGDTDAYCSTAQNCQAAYGICTTTTGGGGGGTGRCGIQGGNAICPTGQCCSGQGYCGTTTDYCQSPICQVGFGTCDADLTPAGPSTSNIPRPKIGTVPYGDIYDCVVPGEIALTYDDGPYIYTNDMLDMLATYGARATFFITGNNNGKGPIDTTPAWNAVIKKMYAAGHQLASHTWSHADLSTLTEARRRDEMIKLEMAMRNIVGFFPTYMRPPYSSCNAACEATLNALGYHVMLFDLDTDDYDNTTPALIQNALNNFGNKVNPSNPATDNFLVIAHDIHPLTATTLTKYMLDTIKAKGYKAVTVGECLGDPQANWYRSAGTVPPPTSSTASVSSTTVIPPASSTVIPPASSTVTPPASSTVTPPASSTTAPTTTTSTTAAPTGTGVCPASSPFKVKTWCATPLATYTTTAKCWDTVTDCWAQGSSCWAKIVWPDSAPCGDYQNVCQLQENNCQKCANANAVDCAFLTPVYPPS